MIQPDQKDFTAAGPTQLTTTDLGKRCTNKGAALVVNLVLPAALPGYEISFQRVANYSFLIDPYSGETIAGGSANKYIELQSRGGVTLTCVSAGSWEVTADTALWDWEP